MAGNMESLLMGGSDDSSSDDELQEVTAGTAASAVAVTAPPAAAPVPPPMPAPPGPKAQSDLSARLKSLYSPANKSTPTVARSVAQVQATNMPAPNITSPPSRSQSSGSHGQQRPQQTQMRSPQQQAGSAYRPLVPNASAKPHQPQPTAVPRAADPFEPTPLRKMLEREQQAKATPPSNIQVAPTNVSHRSMPSQQQRVPPSTSGANNRVAASGIKVSGIPLHHTNSSASTSSSVTTVRATNVAPPRGGGRQDQEAKRRKEKFLMFTRVLMKYLEQKDQAMHARAKAVIRECAEKNKNKEVGYESVTASMQTRLRATVGDGYWKRAENYLAHFLSKNKGKAEAAKLQQKKMAQQQQQQEQERAAARQKIEQLEKHAVKMKQEREKKKEEANARKRAKAREQQVAKKMAQQQQQAAVVGLAKQQREIAARKAALEAVAGKNATVQQQAAAVRNMAQAEAKKSKKAPTDKARKTSTGALAESETVPREYSVLMETIDHAVTYDWTSAGTLLDKDNRVDISLSDEQNKLLYGDKAKPPTPGVQAASMVAATPGTSTLPPALRGWSKRNILSSRSAWARIRLRELHEQKMAANNNGKPVVAGFTLPGGAKLVSAPAGPPAPTGAPAKLSAPTVTWFNEEKAEEDKTLAMLSEATEIYLKSMLEKAIHSARQRENLDGIRLWHLQHSTLQRPPLALRLGCDVKRQAAQAAGNAAKTTQRMEEALERQKGVPTKARALDDVSTLYEASSMADLALRPMLQSAASQADLNAKRSFEVYGGKDSGAPPFGRVPKKAKIEVKDFQFGLENTWFPHQRTDIVASPFV